MSDAPVNIVLTDDEAAALAAMMDAHPNPALAKTIARINAPDRAMPRREVIEMLHPAAARRIGKPVQLVRLAYTVNPTADAVYSAETGELLAPNVRNGGDEFVTIRVSLERLANPDHAQAEVEHAAYQLGCLLFETGGEYNRRPDGSRVMDGNGHHMAQEVAAMVGEKWNERSLSE